MHDQYIHGDPLNRKYATPGKPAGRLWAAAITRDDLCLASEPHVTQLKTTPIRLSLRQIKRQRRCDPPAIKEKRFEILAPTESRPAPAADKLLITQERLRPPPNKMVPIVIRL